MKSDAPKRKLRIRVLYMFTAFAAILILLGVRLVFLQVVQGNELQKKALEQQTRDSVVASKRGSILDRNGKVLAQSSSVSTITANPNEMHKAKKDISEISKALANVLDMNADDIEKQLSKEVNHVTLKRKVEDDVAAQVSELNLTGVYLQEDSKRYYPYGTFASHILGFTGTDNQGLGGIEKVYDAELRGVPGRVISLKNALDSDMPYKQEMHIDPENGTNVVLTIDEVIQHFAEKHLETAYREEKVANGASAIVMDVETGAILAMTSKPDFDLNNPFELVNETEKNRINSMPDGEEKTAERTKALEAMWRNKAVVDAYEPGSCFKIITCCMALEDGVVNENSTFFCPGYRQVETHRISCSHKQGHGSQNLYDAVKNSCNPAFIDIGLAVGKERFKEYYKAFGFLDTTDFDLPGEAKGVFYSDSNYNIVELATASFGQGPIITPLQLISAVGAVANGGNLMKPYLVQELRDDDGNAIKTTEPKVVRQVISEKTSEQMCAMLEYTVSSGTGSNAYIKGYRVAGKTGTSEKVPRGNGKYVASFIGFAPANDPKVICLVVLDEPSNGEYYGGRIAAPVVGKILEDTLRYLKIEPQYTEEERQSMDIFVPDVKGLNTENAIKNLTAEGLKYTKVGNGETVKDQMPKTGASIPSGSVVVLYTDDSEQQTVTVPDVTNLSLSAVRSRLAEAKLNLNISGATGADSNGTPNISVKQDPPAGETAEVGSVVQVEFRYQNID